MSRWQNHAWAVIPLLAVPLFTSVACGDVSSPGGAGGAGSSSGGAGGAGGATSSSSSASSSNSSASSTSSSSSSASSTSSSSTSSSSSTGSTSGLPAPQCVVEMPGPAVFAEPADPYSFFGTASAIGDVNGDGIPDIVVTETGLVTVYLGVGDGTFTAASQQAVAGEGRAYVGDLDGDGKADVVITRETTVAVLHSNGDGTLAAPVLYPLFVGLIRGAVIADFNGDGKLDIAVSHQVSTDAFQKSTVSYTVLTNTGGGGFSVGVPAALGFALGGSIVAGDLDGDGDVDLVVAASPSLYVARNLGNGAFALAIDVSQSSRVDGLALADVSGDGKLDVLVLDLAAEGISILPGQGNGTFGALEFIDAPTARSMAVGDLDGDGKVDILTTTMPNWPGGFDVRWNLGGSAFSDATHYELSGFPAGIADLDGDGHADIVIDDSGVSIVFGRGGRSFAAPVGYGATSKVFPTSVYPSRAVVADFDGDGKPDIAYSTFKPPVVHVHQNLGGGVFAAAPLNLPTSLLPTDLITGDFNGDGRPDLAVTGLQALVNVFYGQPGGAFGAHFEIPVGVSPTSICAADFDQDGQIDFAVTSAGDDTINVLFRASDGTYAPHTIPVGQGPAAIATADFDGDGAPDLAFITTVPNAVTVLFNDGTGSFSTSLSLPVAGSVLSLAVGDLDGDGKPDLVTTSGADQVSVYLDQGGSFGAPVSYTVARFGGYLGIADVDGDGNADLVLAGYDTVGLMRNLGNGALAPPIAWRIVDQPRELTIADLDGDGRKDIAVATRAGDSVTVLFNKPCP